MAAAPGPADSAAAAAVADVSHLPLEDQILYWVAEEARFEEQARVARLAKGEQRKEEARTARANADRCRATIQRLNQELRAMVAADYDAAPMAEWDVSKPLHEADIHPEDIRRVESLQAVCPTCGKVTCHSRGRILSSQIAILVCQVATCGLARPTDPTVKMIRFKRATPPTEAAAHHGGGSLHVVHEKTT